MPKYSNSEHVAEELPKAGSPALHCSALIRRCDICGTINAVDLDATPERWKDLQLPDHTVLRVTESEAVRMWNEHGAKCDHKKVIADLRAKLSSQNDELRHEHPKNHD